MPYGGLGALWGILRLFKLRVRQARREAGGVTRQMLERKRGACQAAEILRFWGLAKLSVRWFRREAQDPKVRGTS